MSDGQHWHDHATNPTGPHRPAQAETPPDARPRPKRPKGDKMANVRAEQIKRLTRVGADPGVAEQLVDEHGAEHLVTLPEDSLEQLVDRQRAASSVDMSTIDKVLDWVYEPGDETAAVVERARIALELEEARRKPRRGVLDPLRDIVAANLPEETQPQEEVTAGAEVVDPDGSKHVETTTQPVADPQPEPRLFDVDVPNAKIDVVLEAVGTDKDLASGAYDAEHGRSSGQPRPRLLEALQAIIDG